MLARGAVDFIEGIEIEHSTISQKQSQSIIATRQPSRLSYLPGVATHNQESIKRLLDSGAERIIVPTV